MSVEMRRPQRLMPFLAEAVPVPDYVQDLPSFRRWVYSDQFPQRGRISYLGGMIEVDMSPEEVETHSTAKGDVTFPLELFVRSCDLGRCFVDGTLLTNEEADLSTEPDVTFCTWDTLETNRVQYGEWTEESERYIELTGSPDLVVEVVSNSSAPKDTVDLPVRYFAAGISEYWIIDARGQEIAFRLLVRGEGAYADAVADSEGWRVSPVLGKSVRLTRERNRVGWWRYTLELC